MIEHAASPSGEPTPEPEKEKPPYTPPAITRHGDAREITEALGSGTKDALTGSALL